MSKKKLGDKMIDVMSYHGVTSEDITLVLEHTVNGISEGRVHASDSVRKALSRMENDYLFIDNGEYTSDESSAIISKSLKKDILIAIKDACGLEVYLDPKIVDVINHNLLLESQEYGLAKKGIGYYIWMLKVIWKGWMSTDIYDSNKDN